MITDHTPTLRELLGDLAGVGPARPDPHRPGTTWLRPALMSTGTQSTYVVPGDWPADPGRWFWANAISYGKRESNGVEYFVDGKKTFAAMLETIETANQPDHFIILLGWAAYFDFVMVERDTPEASRTTLAGLTGLDVLRTKVGEGVKVRVLLWDNIALTEYDAYGAQNNAIQKRALDALSPPNPGSPKPVLCILDAETYSWGSHHHKVLIVGGSEGVVAFFGGIDINPDRVQPLEARMRIGPAFVDVGAPLHDVHARVTGQAALDVLDLAINRWNFSRPVRVYATQAEIDVTQSESDTRDSAPGGAVPRAVPQSSRVPGHDPALSASQSPDELPGRGQLIEDLASLVGPALKSPRTAAPPYRTVQIAQTIGNPVLHKSAVKNAVSDAWPMIRYALRAARRFIYIEDQYMWSKDAAKELAAALPNIQHLTILIAPDDVVNTSLRHEFIDLLSKEAGSEDARRKIGIFTRRFPYHQYVHAKMFVIDDEVAIIGSANCNNRGYHHDSEVIGVIADPAWGETDSAWGGEWHRLDAAFAHKLRVGLWAEHLDMDTGELWDGVAAAVHWRKPPTSANILKYAYEPGAIEPGWALMSIYVDPVAVDPM